MYTTVHTSGMSYIRCAQLIFCKISSTVLPSDTYLYVLLATAFKPHAVCWLWGFFIQGSRTYCPVLTSLQHRATVARSPKSRGPKQRQSGERGPICLCCWCELPQHFRNSLHASGRMLCTKTDQCQLQQMSLSCYIDVLLMLLVNTAGDVSSPSGL